MRVDIHWAQLLLLVGWIGLCYMKNNPVLIQKNQVFFMHMILMHSETQTAMNLGETYIVSETGCERFRKIKIRFSCWMKIIQIEFYQHVYIVNF